MTLVKICGITRPEDAAAAVDAGADLVGLIFAPSPRKVSLRQAEKIVDRLPPTVGAVGVFQDQSGPFLRRVATDLGLSLVQLHGQESRRDLERLPVPGIKAFRFPLQSMADIEAFAPRLMLLDRSDRKGRPLSVSLVKEAIRKGPVILAGGIQVGNVSCYLRQARPYGVDVSSALEIRPGIKDPRKIHQFVREVRRCSA